MKTSPRLERPAPSPRLDNFGRNSSEPFPISTLIKSRFFSAPKLWPADERHVRRPGWTELFYDLVFAAAISQLSTPLEADYSLHGVVHYAFLLALVFLAWLGYTNFSTQFAVDDVVQRALIVAQGFFVAVMAEIAQFSLCDTHESLDCPALGLLLFVVSGGLSQPRLFGPPPHCCLRRIDTSLGASLSQWISRIRGRRRAVQSCCHRGPRIFQRDLGC